MAEVNNETMDKATECAVEESSSQANNSETLIENQAVEPEGDMAEGNTSDGEMAEGSTPEGASLEDNSSESEMTEEQEEVSPEELEQFKEELFKDLPKVNAGAAIMPAVWGLGHGSYITILFYPMWLFVDNLIYGAYTNPSLFSIFFAVVALAAILGVSVFYGATAQKNAYIRYLVKGKTKEQWVSAEKKWTIAMVIIAIVALVLATCYNLMIRPTLGQ
ncbi:MAG: hypothetical protein ACI4BI_00325 [Anaerotardibacter sp.]